MGFMKKFMAGAEREQEVKQDVAPATEAADSGKSYLVRIDINPNFVLEREAVEGLENSPVRKLLALLETADFFGEIRNKFCRSFLVVYLKAENAAQCDGLVRSVWAGLYPDNINAVQVLAYPQDGTEAEKVLGEIYCAYLGWDDYCELTTDMAFEAPIVKEAAAGELVMKRNYLVSIDSGCGFSSMISSFSDYLTRTGYFEEAAPCYHEYIINEDENAGDTTTSTLFDSLYDDEDEDMKEQCIGLDISYYLDREKHDELRKFIMRLHKLQKRYVFMFRIPYLEPKSRKEVYDILADQVHIKEIVIEPCSELMYEECFVSAVHRYGINCAPEVLNLVRERMQLERRDGRFYGFRTAEKIAQEAVLLKIKNNADCKKKGRLYNASVATADELQEMVKGVKLSDKSGYEELHELIGMEEIEARIKEIVAQVKLAKNNEKVDMPCLHMRFTGAPGTGKTTVARIVGKIFKEEGILRKGNFFEYAARSLCGKFVGQTAPKTAQICRDAYGSVLFIDEAYALYAGDGETSSNDYGREAITTLIAEMENHRDDMVVIMAGYTQDMDKLMEANAGLRSRMPFIIEFKSYGRETLAAIFMNYVNKHFVAGEGLEAAVRDYFNSLNDSYLESKEFANARYVRNLYERTWAKAALRISGSGTSDIKITVEDFNSAKSEKEFAEELHVTRTIGFT